MPEFDRRDLARAKSTRATPGELREASQRYKEIQGELRQMGLAPETKQGEERLGRFEREQRLRAMRDDFQDATGTYPRPPRNSALLALVMTVASFLMCAFCGGSTYFGLQLLNQKPSATDVASGFWSSLEAKDYQTAHDAYIGPTLTLQLPVDTFTSQAQQVDGQLGPVTSATLTQQSTLSTTSISLTYAVTRTDSQNTKHLTNVTLVVDQVRGTWGIADIGTLFATPASPSATPHTSG
jgi:hypothetical protein